MTRRVVATAARWMRRSPVIVSLRRRMLVSCTPKEEVSMSSWSPEAGSARSDALSKLEVVKDVLTVRRVFGDAYEADGVTVIPVAALRGAGGGGGGEGRTPDAEGTGSGAGVGFAVNVRPVGVFAVKDGTVTWSPALDVMRIVLGGQAVALAGILILGRMLARRRRPRI
jgi:hypothetical protein